MTPCIKCGKEPKLIRIAGLYYVQCKCGKYNEYEFCGLKPDNAIAQWEYLNRPKNMQIKGMCKTK